MTQSKEELLNLLQAHGQSFLSSFGISQQTSPESKRKKRKLNVSDEESPCELPLENEEWSGFASEGVQSSDDSDGNESEAGEEIEDDEFRSDAIPCEPEVVVFSGSTNSDLPRLSKSQAKAFMSSKISKLSNGVPTAGVETEQDEGDDDEIERNNLKNDALLHKLVHTQILSGSLKSDLNLKPSERRKALEGRVLELAGKAKLGQGESNVRKDERNKASKRVKIGLERKVEERREKSLEDAKNLGNYHHSIKRLFEGDNNSKDDRRRRDRGLKVGVGKFSGGVLKLGRNDIASIQGPDRRGGKNNGAKRPAKRR